MTRPDPKQRPGAATHMIPHPEERATVTVEEAAKALGIGRSAAYAAARRGEIEILSLGRRKLVPTAWLRRVLKLDEEST